jgi:hypothetical protein
MTPFRSALTNLSNLTVTGVLNNYDVDEVPDDLSRGQLPALLVLPGETPISDAPAEPSQGFQTIAFSSGARTVTYTVTHLLLVAPVSAGKGMRSHLPALIDLIDAYFDALSDTVTLSGALREPARVRVDPGVFTHGDTPYHGCAFRHTWVIDL